MCLLDKLYKGTFSYTRLFLETDSQQWNHKSEGSVLTGFSQGLGGLDCRSRCVSALVMWRIVQCTDVASDSGQGSDRLPAGDPPEGAGLSFLPDM